MGQTLSEPVTAKESSYCQNELYRVGSSCMQGWRINMEDSHTHILSLPDDPGTSFFAVYDGHGGSTVAQYAGKHLHKFILKRPEYGENIEKALKQAFLDIDYEMLYNESWGEQMAGSTAVVILIKDNRLYCANAGDSRAIACINGEVETLSLDHKPNNEAETKRINEGGGYVKFNRVNGNLALSRALGDFVFKRNADKKPEEQIVTAYPDVETREINENWEFIVLACDGIWDVMTNKEVVDFCRKRIGMGMYPEEICEELMSHCLAPDCQMCGLGGDNMTVVLVCLLHNKTYDDLIAHCAASTNINNTTTTTTSTSSISASVGNASTSLTDEGLDLK